MQSSDGDLQLRTGNLVIGTSGKGIDFSATADGGVSTPSELLDDYEEGTWTAALTATSGTVAFYSNWNTGRYTKIGNTVQIVGGFYVETISSPTGNLILTGLPFSIGSSPSLASNYVAIPIRLYAWSTSINAVMGVGNSSASTIQIENLNGTSSNIGAYIYAASYIMVGGSYQI
tara:strand:- start:50 stop:571 length:522 start_codon:yes stop_codon:yes gene_type:complete